MKNISYYICSAGFHYIPTRPLNSPYIRMLSIDIIEKFDSFLSKGRLKQGLEVILENKAVRGPLREDLNYLYSSLSVFENKFNLGLLSHNNYSIEVNKIIYSVLLIRNAIDPGKNQDVEYESIVSKEIFDESEISRELLIRRQIDRVDQEWDILIEEKLNNSKPTIRKLFGSVLRNILISLVVLIAINFLFAPNVDEVTSSSNSGLLGFLVIFVVVMFGFDLFRYSSFKLKERDYKRNKKKLRKDLLSG